MKPLVIYHYPCLDGFTAAWAAWLAHPDWEFYQGKYGEPPPDVTGRDVYLLDFSYKRSVLVDMVTKNTPKSITIIDHHKTAQEDLKDFAGAQVFDPAEETERKVIFNMEKSGARLAWEYFHPNEDVPLLVTYIEDRDLWRFKDHNTKPFNAYMFSQDYSFTDWTVISDYIEETPAQHDEVMLMGGAIIEKQEKDVKELSVNKFRANIAGHNVPVINVPYTLASDMCHFLAKNEPFAASFYYDGSRQKFIFSLRSEEKGVDVSEIAKKFGGGGHKHASGFEVLAPIFGNELIDIIREK